MDAEAHAHGEVTQVAVLFLGRAGVSFLGKSLFLPRSSAPRAAQRPQHARRMPFAAVRRRHVPRHQLALLDPHQTAAMAQNESTATAESARVVVTAQTHGWHAVSGLL